MASIPELFSTRVHLLEAPPTEWKNQYDRLRSSEAALVSEARSKDQRVAVSCLAHLIRELDKREAVEQVVLAVQNADEGSFPELGQYYLQYFVRLFKRNGGPTPAPSEHPSHPEVHENLPQVAYHELASANLNHERAKKAALERDGYRCVASGLMHSDAPPTLLDEYFTKYSPSVSLECAHIVPESLNSFKVHDRKKDELSPMYTVLKALGYAHCFDELNGPKIHRLQNILTLEHNTHRCFANLQLWFEHVGHKDSYKYKVCFSNPRLAMTVDKHVYGPGCVVELGPNGNLPAPSRDYLDLHAACSRVVHASGAAEYLDELDRRCEEVDMITSFDDLEALNSRLWITAR